jgi:hypothetical protein
MICRRRPPRLLVDREHPVGVAVVGDAEVDLVGADQFGKRSHVRGTASDVDVHAVPLAVE